MDGGDDDRTLGARWGAGGGNGGCDHGCGGALDGEACVGGRAGIRGGRPPGRRRGGGGVRNRPVAPDERARAGTHPDEGVVPDQGAAGRPRHPRGAQRREADRWCARRDRHRRQHLRVLGWRGQQDLRGDDPDRSTRTRRDTPGAGGSLRLDQPVELPRRDRELEGRSRARVREHRRPEAGVADAADGPRDRGPSDGGGPPRGDPQRDARPRCHDGRRADRGPPRREDRLHRALRRSASR